MMNETNEKLNEMNLRTGRSRRDEFQEARRYLPDGDHGISAKADYPK